MEQFSAGLSDNSVAGNLVLPVPRSEIIFCVFFQQDIEYNLWALHTYIKSLSDITLVFTITRSSHELRKLKSDRVANLRNSKKER